MQNSRKGQTPTVGPSTSKIARLSTDRHGLKPRLSQAVGVASVRSAYRSSNPDRLQMSATISARRSHGTPNKNVLAANPAITPVHNRLGLLKPPSSAMSVRTSISTVRSSFGGRARKEGWPTDGQFKSKCIDKVLGFLITNAATFQYNRTVLKVPTARDFVNIFSFIYQYIDRNHKMPARFEDEIPKLMKNMEYPFQLTKSLFQTVGSPHSWPAVLAMLAWLVNIIETTTEEDPELLAHGDEIEEDTGSRCRCEMVARIKTQGGDDEALANECIQDYSEQMQEEFEVTDHLLEQLQQKANRAKDKIKQLPNTQEALLNQRAQMEKVEVDDAKIVEYNESLRDYLSQECTKLIALARQVQEAQQNIAQINIQCGEIEEMKDAQGYSDEQFKELKSEARENKLLIGQMQQEEKELQDSGWRCEMDFGKMKTALSQRGHKYNSLCATLQVECEISSNNTAERAEWEHQFLPQLRAQKKKLREQNFVAETRIGEKVESKEKIEEKLKSKKCEASKLESRKNRLKEEIQSVKDQIDLEALKFERASKKMNEEITVASMPELQEHLREKQKELDDVKNELLAKKLETSEFLKMSTPLRTEAIDKVRALFKHHKDAQEEYEKWVEEGTIKHMARCKEILES